MEKKAGSLVLEELANDAMYAATVWRWGLREESLCSKIVCKS
jgi:hypothetical protein